MLVSRLHILGSAILFQPRSDKSICACMCDDLHVSVILDTELQWFETSTLRERLTMSEIIRQVDFFLN